MSNLYGHREQENDERFSQLANTLNQFRTTVENDIHAGVRGELSVLDSMNDTFSQLWTRVSRSRGDLTTVLHRNASLARIVGILVAIFFVTWMIYKLR